MARAMLCHYTLRWHKCKLSCYRACAAKLWDNCEQLSCGDRPEPGGRVLSNKHLCAIVYGVEQRVSSPCHRPHIHGPDDRLEVRRWQVID